MQETPVLFLGWEDPRRRDRLPTPVFLGFPCGSAGKESTCNERDWGSLITQLVKNLPAMQATWVQSLGWEDALEKGKDTHSSILAWRIPWTG